MKRGAEKQMRRDVEDDDDDEVSEPGQGFKKADDSVLATRKIRGLPKRVSAGASVSPMSTSVTPEPAPSAPKFGGFGGFGTAATPTSSFSFAAPSAPAAAPPAPPASSFQFGSTPSFTAPSAPAVSSSATNAAKTFASFLTTPSEPKQTPNGVHAQNGATAEDEKVKAETDYYLALRGLNTSFVSAVTKAVDSDPFLDIAELLEKYKSLRSKAKQEYEDSIKKVGSVTTSAASASGFSFGNPKASAQPPAPPATSFSFGSKPAASSDSEAKPAPSMPAPPTTFAGFNPPPASSSTTNFGGFKPQLDSTKSASFTFGEKSSTDSSSSTAPLKSAFSFGAPSSGKSPFSFGDSSNKSDTPSSSSSSAFPSSTPSIFSSNLFPSSADSSKEKDSEKTLAPSASSTSAFAGGLTFGTSDKPPTSTPTKLPFGTSATSPSRPAAFTFGAAAPGSIGNPVGFGFGSPPKTPDEGKPAPAASTSKFGGFSFGAPPALKSAEASEAGGDTDASSRADTPVEDAPPLLAAASAHDAEGEGEEDEETKYEIRTKVYRMMKKKDGNSEWTDVGIGMLRVKAHKETGTRRLLLRNSSTGKITINFNVYKGMNPSVAKNVVSFMGHDEGNSVPFKLRVKTNEQADELKKALEREIEFVKAKSSD